MLCPECGSSKIFKAGLRYLADGETVQRWLCRSCGYRFSQPNVKVNVTTKTAKLLKPGSDLAEKMVSDGDFVFEKSSDGSSFFSGEDVGAHGSKPQITVIGKELNSFRHYNSKRQICAVKGEAKNLDSATENKTVAGEMKTTQQQESKGKIIEFAFWMQKQGYAEQTITNRAYMLKRLADLGAFLGDPETVKETIARQKWGESYKAIMVDAYTLFLKWQGQEWEPPRYKITTTMAFIPTELELDQLIAACQQKRNLLSFKA